MNSLSASLDPKYVLNNWEVIKYLEDPTDENFDRVFTRYERMIIKIINGFKASSDTYAREEMHQEAKVRLFNCLKNFKLELGIAFSTYLYVSITTEMKEVDSSYWDLIKIPSYLKDFSKAYNKIRSELEIILQRPPTEEEIKEKFPDGSLKQRYESKLLLMKNTMDQFGGDYYKLEPKLESSHSFENLEQIEQILDDKYFIHILAELVVSKKLTITKFCKITGRSVQEAKSIFARLKTYRNRESKR